MATILKIISSSVLIFFISSLLAVGSSAQEDADRKVYIVYLGSGRGNHQTGSSTYHLTLLDQVLQNKYKSSNSLVCCYTRSFQAFAAKLTLREKELLAGIEGVVSIFPSRILKPQTTRSWDFLNLPEDVDRDLPMESDVIVGMLDTGIWPESKSFDDEGLGPIPSKWNGTCINLNCNKKIIGARFYNAFNDTSEEQSPRDFIGHGTHTSSTVAGRNVNASLYGLAEGTARGGVPSARLAVYKVCWSFGCSDVDILAAFDDAIADRVDIISISIGYSSAMNYFEDTIAIGSFHAMQNGILVSASGGNSGPARGTVSNVAPWMLVAAASTTDRNIVDKLEIGGKEVIWGASINTFTTEDQFYPLVYNDEFLDCYYLNATLVRDKIVLCGSLDQGNSSFIAGAKGTVQVENFDLDSGFSFALPGLAISHIQGQRLKSYINSTQYPVGKIYKSEELVDHEAPVVAGFSSRGPNTITANILKPDLSAPGVHILAAWSPNVPITGLVNDARMNNYYNIISGTSMACPHISGAAAYIKSFHPDWSPAAIMSALITTATPMNPSLSYGAEFAYGSGQINPTGALNPGLVYDANVTDYIHMLCEEGYTESSISVITGINISCSSSSTNGSSSSSTDLNYPSMALYVGLYRPFNATFRRTVTNVGTANSRYNLTITDSLSGKFEVKVEPTVLKFERLNEKKKFAVTVSGMPFSLNSYASAAIAWASGDYNVRSVVVVYTDSTF